MLHCPARFQLYNSSLFRVAIALDPSFVIDKDHISQTLSTLLDNLETEKQHSALFHFHKQANVLHHLMINHDLCTEISLLNKLLSVYVKCGSLSEALNLFDRMDVRNVVSWSAIVAGYSLQCMAREAQAFFERMQNEGCYPNLFTFITLLSAFGSPGFLSSGQWIHSQIRFNDFDGHVIVGTALIKMYSDCSAINCAREVFDGMSDKDIICWTAMMTAYLKHGCGRKTVELFHKMVCEGIMPNEYTCNALLTACASIPSLFEGKRVHACMRGLQFELFLFVANALLDMYAKCGSIQLAHSFFKQMPKRDSVSWNAMITAFAQNGDSKEALLHFEQMKKEGLQPDQFTFSCVISICSSMNNMGFGREVHHQIQKAGFLYDASVVHALIDMYAKCGDMKEAHKLFDKIGFRDEISCTSMITGCVRHHLGLEAIHVFKNMPNRDVCAWTAMIQGYAQHGNPQKALDLFREMHGEEVSPNEFTFGTALSACAALSDIDQGRELHAYIAIKGCQLDITVGNALVDMYARCGSMLDGLGVFANMSHRDVVSWNTMIGSCAQHGKGKEALHLFRQMQSEGVKPDEFTFSSVLSACKHTGLLGEGLYYFNCMIQEYGITPLAQHYNCVVDLLGRAGCVHEADEFIKEIPWQPNAAVWTSLLSACRSRSNLALAEKASNQICTLDPKNVVAHLLLSEVSTTHKQWNGCCQ